MTVLVIAGLCVAGAGGAAIALGVSDYLSQQSNDSIRAALEHAQPFNDPNAAPAVVPTSSIGELSPMLLVAPAAQLRVPLVSLGLNGDGDIAIPPAEQASVYTGSVPLDSSTGSTLISGHVSAPDTGEFAPMSHIVALRPGDLVVTVDDAGTRQDWRVVSSEVVDRDGLRPSMWAADGDRQLVLITCAGETGAVAEGVEFTDNLIVTAVPEPTN